MNIGDLEVPNQLYLLQPGPTFQIIYIIYSQIDHYRKVHDYVRFFSSKYLNCTLNDRLVHSVIAIHYRSNF